MVREFVILLAIALQSLAISTCITTHYLLGTLVVALKTSVNHKTLLSMTYALRVGYGVHRACHRQVVYGIENICLSRAIIPNKTVDAL